MHLKLDPIEFIGISPLGLISPAPMQCQPELGTHNKDLDVLCGLSWTNLPAMGWHCLAGPNVASVWSWRQST